MSLHITDKELKKCIKNIGYKGCKNCKHQITPSKMCNWGKQGSDGRLHFICPKWDKRDKN